MDCDTNDAKVIETITAEYEKKLEDQKRDLEEAHKKEIEALEAKHINQIKALMSGRMVTEQQEDNQEVKSFEEEMIEQLSKKYKL